MGIIFGRRRADKHSTARHGYGRVSGEWHFLNLILFKIAVVSSCAGGPSETFGNMDVVRRAPKDGFTLGRHSGVSRGPSPGPDLDDNEVAIKALFTEFF